MITSDNRNPLLLISKEYSVPPSPNFAVRELPEGEQALALSLCKYLAELRNAAQSYIDAWKLVEHCAPGIRMDVLGELISRSLWMRWWTIASQYCVISARNYRQNLMPITGLAGRINGWAPHIDFDLLKLAGREFEERFPNIDTVRHSVVHPELYPNPDKRMIPEPVVGPLGIPQVVLRTVIGPGRYAATFGGKGASCEVSSEAALALKANTEKVFDAFRAVPNPH